MALAKRCASFYRPGEQNLTLTFVPSWAFLPWLIDTRNGLHGWRKKVVTDFFPCTKELLWSQKNFRCFGRAWKLKRRIWILDLLTQLFLADNSVSEVNSAGLAKRKGSCFVLVAKMALFAIPHGYESTRRTLSKIWWMRQRNLDYRVMRRFFPNRIRLTPYGLCKLILYGT